jgi:hypothetical protein
MGPAAAELNAHNLPIGANRIGTLHSMCFHALEQPQIAEANVADWNRAHPDLRITPVRKQRHLDGEEPIEDASDHTLNRGDGLLQRLNCCRGSMIDRRHWPAEVRDFEALWSRYKRNVGLLDFADLIETCLRDLAAAPGRR